MWGNFIEVVQPYWQPLLPVPLWVEHAGLAFVIICLAMLFRRSLLCRLAVAVTLLVSGGMLLGLVPPPSMAGLVSAEMASGAGLAKFKSLVMSQMGGQRQFAEIALLSLGSAWILDELRAVIVRRRATVKA
jgi:hypothetical protein